VGEAYERGRYAEGLQLLDDAGPGLDPWASDLTHLRACLLGALGEPDAAMAVLREGLARGDWWHERILLDDEDLIGLRDVPGFAALVEESARRCRADASSPPPPPVVVAPASAARGTLVVLHGAGQDVSRTASAWSAATSTGWTVVAVASTQRNTPAYASWPDQRVAERDVARALGEARAPRTVPLVSAGFSAGGRAAILWALRGSPVPVLGVVSVAPAIRPELVPAVHEDVRGRVLVGVDDDLADAVRATVAGLPGVRLDLVAGLGHRLPDGFPGWLVQSLEDVLSDC